MGLASVEHEYLNGRATLNCGDATATDIDHEVMKMLKESYEQAKQMLCEHRKTCLLYTSFTFFYIGKGST